MGKLLTWVLIGLAVWGAWRMWTISQRRAERARAQREAGDVAGRGADAPTGEGTARVAGPERMMQCAVCGLHLPGSEARFAGGKVYCSDAHRDRAAAEPPGRAEP